MKLLNKVNQLVLLGGKPLNLDVKHCFMKNGNMYGKVIYNAVTRHLICNQGVWEAISFKESHSASKGA
jgi:hypothetical protein